MKTPIQHIKEFLYGTPFRRTSDGIYEGINFIYKKNILINQNDVLIIWRTLSPPIFFILRILVQEEK